ncbi:unnamed protein product [Polarella glacialis]|uniref:Uncharacterized protein n=1 Tax=Polarella glacialis TaxID=89957 RepID=A0A813JAW3_POLGL|nr:unnamed protein product [Polarella glacialis]CAE8639922.1 unnamed protein product [Polarella glacialis]CAE8672484.1 unnamed protein product [Polarella glacialis]
MLQNTIEIAEHVQPPECGCTAHVLLSSKATGLGVEARGGSEHRSGGILGPVRGALRAAGAQSVPTLEGGRLWKEVECFGSRISSCRFVEGWRMPISKLRLLHQVCH